jgi:hypothetical protein
MKVETESVDQPALSEGGGRAFVSSISALLVAVSVLGPPDAWGSAISEAELKAAFLLNFTRFVEWPESSFEGPDGSFVICVLNDSNFATTTADVIGDRTVNKRRISVQERESGSDTGGCHIFFVPEAQSSEQRTLIDQTSGRSVLTISETDGFAKMGGVANFIANDKKLRLEINRSAAEKANLKVSSRLLRIADVVS